MNNIFTIIAFISYSMGCIRLLCYRRGRANYRAHVSWLAGMLIFATGTSALEILIGHGQTTLGRACIAVTLCILIFRAKGNVANIIGVNL